jgi:hypothetical protein
MPIGGFIKASRRLPRLICTRTDPVALAYTSRSPVASHNVYDVDTGDDDSDDLDGPPVDPAVLIVMPTLDGTATSAMDTNGCTTLALTNADMFDGSPHMAYLDSGNQLPAVLQARASLDELETTTGHLNGAVAGSQMRITHTGILRLAPGSACPPWSARRSPPTSSACCPCSMPAWT